MSKKIIVNKPEEFYTLQNLTDSNLVVIHYTNMKRDINRNEVLYKSITYDKFYVAEKSHLYYTLHTMDYFDRKGNTGYIKYNRDSRFIEYQIEGYILHEGLIYPVIKIENNFFGIIEGQLKSIGNLEVKPVVWDKKNEKHITHILKSYNNIQYGKSNLSSPGVFITERYENSKPCCEIALPTQPMKAPEFVDIYFEFKYHDQLEVDDINWIPTAENVDVALYTEKKPYKKQIVWSPTIAETNKITWIPKHDIEKNELTKINF